MIFDFTLIEISLAFISLVALFFYFIRSACEERT